MFQFLRGYILFSAASLVVHSFVVPHHDIPSINLSKRDGKCRKHRTIEVLLRKPRDRLHPLHIIEPGLVDITIAVVSAAAGAASQGPRIAELERQRKALAKELEVAKSSLAGSEAELVSKVSELEDKLFLMDEEFESQTARMKKDYDTSLRQELEQLTSRLKSEFKEQIARLEAVKDGETQLKLAEQKARLRQGFLMEKYEYVNDLGGKNREELNKIRLQQQRTEQVNKELEEALNASKAAIEDLRNRVVKKGPKWWPFG